MNTHQKSVESTLPTASSSAAPETPDKPDVWLDERFSLRTDLKFDSREENGATFIVIEDTVRSKYFQIGPREYRLIASMDGTKTPREILQQFNAFDDQTLTQTEPYSELEVTEICQWIVKSNLAFGESIDNGKRLDQQAAALKRSRMLGLMNPISCKFRLFNPNRALTAIQPYTQWIFSRWFLAVWCVTAVYVLTQVYAHWDQMGSASRGILSGYSWIWLILTWVGLKIVHESAHGIACRRYGGEVPEAGILLLLFTPMAYVNVTSMWRFPNRWHRMVVSAAGMYVELFVSFLSLIIWTRTTGLAADIALNVFLMSSVTTLLFNANPLMRFDGYFLLSDLMGIPNLYSKGTKWFGDQIKSLIFGVPTTASLCKASEQRSVAIYGSLAFFWKISISISLTIGAGVLFQGLGLILSLFGIGLWFGLPIYAQLKQLFGPQAVHPVKPFRLALSLSILAAIGFGMFTVLKAPATKSAPAIVQFAEESQIRAGAQGFIGEILVGDGESVIQGQTLVVLTNPRLSNDVAELQRWVNESKIQYRIYQKQDELSLALAEQMRHEELGQQLIEKQGEANGLVIKAPFDGFIMRRDLSSLVGSFVHRGDPLLTLAQKDVKEVVLSIDQRDFESLKRQQDKVIRVALPGLSVFACKVKRIDSRASQTPSHPSLCAQAGGALPVRPAQTESADEPAFELLSPRFDVTLQLDNAIGIELECGQRGRGFFSTCEQSLGSYFYLAASDWIKSKIEVATQTAAF